MAVFQSRKYPSASQGNTLGARYRAMMAKHPFLLFGLPFLTVIVGASFVLTPATAIRYERYDRKVRQMTREEELGVGKDRRKVNIREEYYVRLHLIPISFLSFCFRRSCCWRFQAGCSADLRCEQRLAAKDLDNWEQKRVKRLPGEHDGIL
jgi:cytochrome c oxidase assembly protein subunit 16